MGLTFFNQRRQMLYEQEQALKQTEELKKEEVKQESDVLPLVKEKEVKQEEAPKKKTDKEKIKRSKK